MMQIKARTVEMTEKHVDRMFRAAEERFMPTVTRNLLAEFFDPHLAEEVPLYSTRAELRKNIVLALHSPEEIRSAKL